MAMLLYLNPSTSLGQYILLTGPVNLYFSLALPGTWRSTILVTFAPPDPSHLHRGIKMKDIQQLLDILPHRYPFLMIDRVIEIEPGKRAVGLKNVTYNEPFFQGHFPGYPVMPGVLIVEAMAQVTGVALLAQEEYRGRLGFFAGIDGVRFREQVRPGDCLRIEAEILRARGQMARARCVATVEGKVAAEGEVLLAIGPKREDGDENL